MTTLHVFWLCYRTTPDCSVILPYRIIHPTLSYPILPQPSIIILGFGMSVSALYFGKHLAQLSQWNDLKLAA